MDPSLLLNLPKSISPARLDPYLTACSGNSAQAVRLYTWNIEASASLWGELHVFEISLRNAIHDQMTNQFGMADWWTDSKVQLTSFQRDKLAKATSNAQQIATKKQRLPTPGDTVASTIFSFWTGFFPPKLNDVREHRKYLLFLKNIFPNHKDEKVNFTFDFNCIRDIRNRIAHHEPIFSQNLLGEHKRILRIAGYIDDDIAQYIKSHSRIMESLDRRNDAVMYVTNTRF